MQHDNFKMPLTSVLVKPAGPDCNLNCSYCFYLEKSALFPEQKKHRMSEEMLQELVKQMMQQGARNISFGWQGGEPTLMGREFFERAVQFQSRYGRPGQVVGNGLQTNGMLIDDDFARFLSDAQFLIGLSLDGPEHIHNKYRKFKGGQPTWDKVMRAKDRLFNAGAEVNALTVVNDYSVKFAREIYNFHKKNGLINMQFIPCVEPDPAGNGKAAPYSVDAAEYGLFLCELFDLWIADFRYGQPTTFVRWFDSVFYIYVGQTAPECTLLDECGVYVVVEHNGNVYSCDFYVQPDWHLGNIMQDQMSEMLNSPKQNQFGRIKKQLPEECVNCQWLRHCFGGCAKERQNDPRDRGSNHFCQAFKMFFAHADKKLAALANEWKKNNGLLEPEKSPAIAQTGRNEPCPCGSGRKYKKCCGQI